MCIYNMFISAVLYAFPCTIWLNNIVMYRKNLLPAIYKAAVAICANVKRLSLGLLAQPTQSFRLADVLPRRSVCTVSLMLLWCLLLRFWRSDASFETNANDKRQLRKQNKAKFLWNKVFWCSQATLIRVTFAVETQEFFEMFNDFISYLLLIS